MLSSTNICDNLAAAIATDKEIQDFCLAAWGKELTVCKGLFIGPRDKNPLEHNPFPYIEVSPDPDGENQGGRESSEDTAAVEIFICVKSRLQDFNGRPVVDKATGVLSTYFERDLETLGFKLAAVSRRLSNEGTLGGHERTVSLQQNITGSKFPICCAILRGEYYNNPSAFDD